MPLHAIELVLDPVSDARIRAHWRVLVEAGLPSQARHRGATNAPHVTLVSAARLDAAIEGAAITAIGPLLPAAVDVTGLALFGGGPYVLARLLAPTAKLDEAVREVRLHVPRPSPSTWTPHVTLARRLPADRVGEALAALATRAAPVDRVVLAGLRRWNPDTGTTHPLTPAP